MNFAYCRVSTKHQHTENQEKLLTETYKIDEVVQEEKSGKNITDRPALQDLLKRLRKDDIVYCYDFSRMARNTKDLLEIVELIESKGAKLISHKEGLDTSTPTGRLMVTMIGAIAEFERQNLLERQRLGCERARENGAFKGKQLRKIDDNLFNYHYNRYKTREINKGQLAEALGLSRPALERHLKARGLV